MKKNFKYAWLGAIALTGVVGFTACSTDNGVEEVNNPKYNPETGEVLTNVVFSVSTSNQGTRMTPATVQEGTGTFRGIQNAILLTYKAATDGSHITDPATTPDKLYDVDGLIGAHALNEAGKPDSRRVLEMSLPTGTNTIMMWGRAIKDGTGSAQGSAQGSITFSPSQTLSDAMFRLNPCVPDDGTAKGKTGLLQYEKLIVTVLNKIVQASATINVGGVDKTLKWSDYVNFADDGTLTLKTYDPSTYDPNETSHAPMSALGAIMGNLFITLNTFNGDELRNGEGLITAALAGDVYDVMSTVTSATSTTDEENAAQALAGTITGLIGTYFENATGTWRWKKVSQFQASLGLADSEISLINKTGDVLNAFPCFEYTVSSDSKAVLFRLPPGATVMKYTAVKDDPDHEGQKLVANEYSFLSSVPTYAMGAAAAFDPFNYMYPAELCYFGNSPIRVTSDTHIVSDYPDGSDNWDDDEEWAAGAAGHNNTVAWTKNGHVLSSTRSVAMQENINYGTALLKTTVKYGATTLEDNNKGLHPTEAANTITPGGDGFELTGILIGGQPQTVGWNYLPKGDDGSGSIFCTMVYDDQLPSTSIPAFGAGSTAANYTMVWDNWNWKAYSDGAQQNKVYVALQFKNNLKDFWGRNNIIRKGSTFYIVGELDPQKTSASELTRLGVDAAGFASNHKLGPNWPTKYALPPYDGDGNTIQERRVFIQDFVTTANFTIGVNSLKYALVSVPDLRSTQQSLGLSVDLSWSQGLLFDDVELGTHEQ